jgi:RNA polymerase sigma-70 factor (ECF subfamily)
MDDVRPSAAMNGGGPAPDGALATRIAAGDEDAFMEAYDRHADAVFGVVTRLLGDREAATEIVQETYETLWRRASLFDPAAGTMRGWLMRIARNRSIDRLRADARRPRTAHVGGAATTADDVGPFDVGAEPGHPVDDPEAAIERRWIRAVVRTALTILPPDERHVLVLAYDEGLSQSEIAARLAIPIGTVKSRTRRAMVRLREMLGGVPELTGQGPREEPDGAR